MCRCSEDTSIPFAVLKMLKLRKMIFHICPGRIYLFAKPCKLDASFGHLEQPGANTYQLCLTSAPSLLKYLCHHQPLLATNTMTLG